MELTTNSRRKIQARTLTRVTPARCFFSSSDRQSLNFVILSIDIVASNGLFAQTKLNPLIQCHITFESRFESRSLRLRHRLLPRRLPGCGLFGQALLEDSDRFD